MVKDDLLALAETLKVTAEMRRLITIIERSNSGRWFSRSVRAVAGDGQGEGCYRYGGEAGKKSGQARATYSEVA